MVLFWRKGFAATSMNDLCDAMNVRSPSLYAAFGSKEALYLEAIEHYVLTSSDRRSGTSWRKARRRAQVLKVSCSPRLRSCQNPRDDSGRLHGDAGRNQRRMAGRNCRTVRKIRVDMLGMLRSRLEAGVADGELPPTMDIERLEPILSRRLPGDGRPGPRRRCDRGTERRCRGGNGRLARRRSGLAYHLTPECGVRSIRPSIRDRNVFRIGEELLLQ